MDLVTLRRNAEEFLFDAGRAELDQHTGLGDANYQQLYRGFQDLTSRDALDCAREARAAASEERTRRSLGWLVYFVARVHEGWRAARYSDERVAFERGHVLTLDGEPVPFRDAWRQIRDQPERTRREKLYDTWAASLAGLDKALWRRTGEGLEVAVDLGFASPEALFTETTGIDLAALVTEARRLLDSTEDAYRDLMGFALKRTVGPEQLHPRGRADAHDLVRFSRLPTLDDVLPRNRASECALAFHAEMGLSPDATGRIQVDDDERTTASPAPLAVQTGEREFCAVAPPLGPARAHSAMLHALGHAQHLALADPELPLEDRRLGDPAFSEAFALLYERLLLDTRFLERRLDADRKDAGQAASLLAIDHLRRLRLSCAGVIYERALRAEGPVEEMKGFYRETFMKAMAVDWPVEPWLFEVQPWYRPAARLRAHALEGALYQSLRERGDEDWWRNPRTGGLLNVLFSRGTRGTPEELAKELGVPLSLDADRLIEIAAR